MKNELRTALVVAFALVSGAAQAQVVSSPDGGKKRTVVIWRNLTTHCNQDQDAAIKAALPQAAGRVFKVQQEYALAESRKRELDVLGRTIFGQDYDKVDIDSYIRGMRDVLMSKPAIYCSAGDDEHCSGRSGYVKTGERIIHVCPNFFNSNVGGTAVDQSAEAAEQRVRTLVHESAHVAGISEHDGKESYCVVFTCDSSCGEGANVADNWSQWVHCGSGQSPDKIQAITASPSRP
jgi:hypothetical protein